MVQAILPRAYRQYSLALPRSGWSDNKIYCSELIWKIYKRGAGLEIGKLEKIKDYDFTNPKVQQKAKERYGNNIPEEEMVISPVAIFNSPLLFTVASNE